MTDSLESFAQHNRHTRGEGTEKNQSFNLISRLNDQSKDVGWRLVRSIRLAITRPIPCSRSLLDFYLQISEIENQSQAMSLNLLTDERETRGLWLDPGLEYPDLLAKFAWMDKWKT